MGRRSNTTYGQKGGEGPNQDKKLVRFRIWNRFGETFKGVYLHEGQPDPEVAIFTASKDRSFIQGWFPGSREVARSHVEHALRAGYDSDFAQFERVIK